LGVSSWELERRRRKGTLTEIEKRIKNALLLDVRIKNASLLLKWRQEEGVRSWELVAGNWNEGGEKAH